MSASIWPTSSAASPTCPVTAPSCSIWSYTSPMPAGAEALPVRQVERVELGEEVGVGAVGDHQVGLVAGDRLDVRLVRRQVGDDTGRLGRELRQAVDGDDLVAGADGEEHLGVRRRQRHDAARHVVCGRRRRGGGRRRGRGDGRCGRLDAAGGSVAAESSVVVAATRGEQERTGEHAGEDGLHTFLHLLGGQDPAASPRTALASRVWLSHAGPGDRTRPHPRGGFTVAGQCRDLTGLRWVLRPAER